MSRHVTDDILADYLEDLLSPDDHATVSAHLGYCTDCAGRRDGQEALRTMLQHVGSRADPMPPAIVARLDAVLATEAESRGGQGGPTPITKPRHRHHHRRPTRGATRLLAAAAAAVVLGGGAVAAYSVFGANGPSIVAGGPQPSTSATSSTPRGGPTTFTLKPGAALSELSTARFSAQVKALVVRSHGGKATNKPFGTEQKPGIVGPPTHCVEQVLAKAHAGDLLDSKPAQLDGKSITLAIARSATGVVRAYAVNGCPGINARVVKQADLRAG